MCRKMCQGLFVLYHKKERFYPLFHLFIWLIQKNIVHLSPNNTNSN